MSMAKNCALCDSPATVWSGHLHQDDRTLSAGWCKTHHELGRLATQAIRPGRPGCEGCYGDWKESDGDSRTAAYAAALKRGAFAGTCKLTPEKVRLIRAKHKAGATTKELAAENKCAISTIQQILTRKTWRHI